MEPTNPDVLGHGFAAPVRHIIICQNYQTSLDNSILLVHTNTYNNAYYIGGIYENNAEHRG